MTCINRKVVSNKTKILVIENKLKKFDLSYFRGKSHFEEDGTQNWYVFQIMGKYLKVAYTNDINYILSWKSKGLSNVEINSIKTNNYLLNLYLDTYGNNKIRIKFYGSFSNRFPPTIPHGDIANIGAIALSYPPPSFFY